MRDNLTRSQRKRLREHRKPRKGLRETQLVRMRNMRFELVGFLVLMGMGFDAKKAAELTVTYFNLVPLRPDDDPYLRTERFRLFVTGDVAQISGRYPGCDFKDRAEYLLKTAVDLVNRANNELFDRKWLWTSVANCHKLIDALRLNNESEIQTAIKALDSLGWREQLTVLRDRIGMIPERSEGRIRPRRARFRHVVRHVKKVG